MTEDCNVARGHGTYHEARLAMMTGLRCGAGSPALEREFDRYRKRLRNR